jgi:hypothetical protein
MDTDKIEQTMGNTTQEEQKKPVIDQMTDLAAAVFRPCDCYSRIVLQKSFCGMGLKFSEAWARRLNNDVGGLVAKRQTHRRFWQRV